MEPIGWQTVWTSPGERLIVHAKQEDGWIRHRFISNSEGTGAVVLATHNGNTLFIESYRPALDKTLWELPRGQADLGDITPYDTARRELYEETGLTASDCVVLGQVYPDSGLSGDAVNVVHATVDDLLSAGNPEYALLRWLSLNEVQAAIADGRIRDGITLSALMLEQAQDVRA